ncbi:Hexose_transporter [Hexamita inflata]|uniref:Hexose_transporter n=1 Tax=Hexamita inflata TaxID=28002 RepID=A0ABP1HK82_9EUKA
MNSFTKIVSLSFLVANNYGGALSSMNSQILALYQQKSYVKFTITPIVDSLVTVSIIIGFMFGSIFASSFAKKFSKRNIGGIASLIALACNLLMIIPVHWGYLVVMRILSGAAIMTIMTLIPGWLFDLSTPAQRNVTSSSYQFFLCLGIFINSLTGLIIKDDPDKFWITFIYDSVINFLCSIVCFSIKDVKTEVYEESTTNLQENTLTLPFNSPKLLKSKITAVLFSLGAQISGINVVMMYATSIFQNLFNSPLSSVYGSLIAGGVNALGCLPSIPLIPKLKRKTILLSGWFLMNLGQVILIIGNVLNNQMMILAGSIVFLFGFEFGPGTMTVVVLGEIFPRQFTQQLNSLGYSVMWATNIIVILTFPFFKSIVWAAYVIYFVASLLCGIVLIFTMPETKGKSVKKIEAEILGQKDGEEGENLVDGQYTKEQEM